MKKEGTRDLSRLTNEELIDLLRRTVHGESSACDLSRLREEIVARNVGLVKSIALEFRNAGEPLDDLIQAGYIGLLNAVANFDLSRNTRFSTYATYLIKGEIRHYIRDKHSMIRIPQWVQAVNRRVKEEEEAFFQEAGRPPSITELAERLDLSEAQLVELLRGRETMTYVSIDEEKRSEDPHPDPPDFTHLASSREGLSFDLRMRILVAIEQLAEIERQVIQGLFYQGKSQAEVGRELGMSQRQVSRMKEATLEEVKRRLVKPDRKDRKGTEP
jgi:RNA polymerase sigma factor (sigma-70 family)